MIFTEFHDIWSRNLFLRTIRCYARSEKIECNRNLTNVGHATYFCVLSDAMLDRKKLRDDLKDRNFAYRYTQPFLLALQKK